MKIINLEFKGYGLEESLQGLPDKSGVYCVYPCFPVTERDVSINRLLYIGESDNLNHRLNNHEKIDDWKKALKSGEVLCFTYALVKDEDRERAEAALIYKHKPRLNKDNKDTFDYQPTRIISSGKINSLIEDFVVP